MALNSRLEELRRRVEKDPASVAFAQLAEEYRRAGAYDDAIRVARAGLDLHPGYLSARVTLGRALIELGEYDEARGEFEQVLRAAPDNLGAIRGLAELHQRRHAALELSVTPADTLPPLPPEVPPVFVDGAADTTDSIGAPGVPDAASDMYDAPHGPRTFGDTPDLTYEQALMTSDAREFDDLSAPGTAPARLVPGRHNGAEQHASSPVDGSDPALAELEAWLAALAADRRQRS